MYKIPQNGSYTQINRGDSLGQLSKSLNIDLKTNEGRLKISPNLTLNTKSDDSGITGMGIPLAFEYFNSKYYAACGIGVGTGISNPGTGKLLVSSSGSPAASFVTDTTSNSPTDIHSEFCDMVGWADGNYGAADLGYSLFVSTYDGTNNNIKKCNPGGIWNTTWWGTTVSGAFKNNGSAKNLCPGFNGNLYVIDDDCIHYVPKSTSNSAQNVVLAYSGTSGTGAAGTIYTAGRFRILWIKSSSNFLWIGLMSFNKGSGAKGYVARWDGTGTAFNQIFDIGAPCPLAGVIKDDVPYIIDAYGRLQKFNGTGFSEIARLPVANMNIEMPGIYIDYSNARWIHHRGMDIVDGKININVSNYVSSGVYVDSMPAGVWEYDENKGLYHKNAPQATATDFGQQQLDTAGALFGTKRSTATYLAGYNFYTDATTTKYGIFYDDVADDVQKNGSFSTTKIFAQNIAEAWEKVVARFKQFSISTDQITVKYRTQEIDPTNISLTWTAGNTFTTSTDVSALTGYEVDVLQGIGSGKTAHITSVSGPSGGLYTVTLDESFPGVSSGTAKAALRNWTKLGSITDDTAAVKLESTIDSNAQNDVWIQLKVCLQLTGPGELYDLILENSKAQ